MNLIDCISPNKDRRYAKVIGQREYMSAMDVERLNIMYRCPNNGRIPGRQYFPKFNLG